MRLKIGALALGLILLPLAAACGTSDDDGGTQTPPASPTRIELRYDFNEGEQGWEAGFTDYGPEIEVDTRSGIEPLPDSLGQSGTGFMLSGMNRSDDLFMFLKRQIGANEGVQAGQSYRVTYRLVIASDAATGCMGIGGAPGESVFLKAGAVAEEPLVELRDGYWHLTVDKDNQSSGGRDVWLVGDIANGIECEESIADGHPYASIEREYTHTEVVTADANGELWLIVGTDSGFEGRTELFYQVIEVTLEPAD